MAAPTASLIQPTKDTLLTPDKLFEIINLIGQMTTLGQISDYLKTLVPPQQAASSPSINQPTQKQPEKVLPTLPPLPAPAIPPETIIKRTEFPKWWKNLSSAKIDIASEGSQILIPWRSGHFSYMVSMFFVCDGETDIYLRLGSESITGPMSFGGTDEPRGMTINFGEGPIPCADKILSIVSDPPSPPVQVAGIAIYYTEPSEKALK